MKEDENNLSWMSSGDASKYLRISISRLHNLTSLGHMKYYKFGRSNRYKREDLDKLVISNDHIEALRVSKIKADKLNN